LSYLHPFVLNIGTIVNSWLEQQIWGSAMSN